jgi:putative membrane protein
MSRTLFIAAFGSLALAACAANSDMAAGDAAPAAGEMTPTSRDAYVRMAAASDLYEIRSSQLAQTRTQNGALRDFAGMLIRDHTNTTTQLMAAAQAAGMPPMTPALMPMQRDMLSRLEAASGAAFDREFTAQQAQAHQMALALHSNYASSGDTPALRQVASTAVPVIQHHLDQVRGMAGGM